VGRRTCQSAAAINLSRRKPSDRSRAGDAAIPEIRKHEGGHTRELKVDGHKIVDFFGIAGGVPVYVDCDAQKGFHLDARALERVINPHTRWLILNSSNNPLGAVFTRAELRAISDVLAHPHVLV
jgi:hypothetical protein